MKITLLADISGLRDGVPWPGRGHAITVPDDEAEHMIAGGLAKKHEKADEQPDEAPKVKGPEIPEPHTLEAPDAPPAPPAPRPAKKAAAKRAPAKKAASSSKS